MCVGGGERVESAGERVVLMISYECTINSAQLFFLTYGMGLSLSLAGRRGGGNGGSTEDMLPGVP